MRGEEKWLDGLFTLEMPVETVGVETIPIFPICMYYLL